MLNVTLLNCYRSKVTALTDEDLPVKVVLIIVIIKSRNLLKIAMLINKMLICKVVRLWNYSNCI